MKTHSCHFSLDLISRLFFSSISLFSLGNDLGKWRIPGVLQRFGISYFVVATVSLWMSPSEEKQDVCSLDIDNLAVPLF